MPARNTQPDPLPPPALATITVLASIIAIVLVGAPGAIVAWAGLALTSAMSRPPRLTGRKDYQGRPTPMGQHEEKLLTQHAMWKTLARNVCGAGLTPLTPLRLSTISILGLTLLILATPSVADTPWWARLVGALFTILTLTGIDATLRTGRNPLFVYTGTLVSHATGTLSMSAAVVGALAGGAGAWLTWDTDLFYFNAWHPIIPVVLAVVGGVLAGASGGAILTSRWKPVAQWHDSLQAATRYADMWRQLKVNTPPTLTDRTTVDGITVDTFDTTESVSQFFSAQFRSQLAPIAPTVMDAVAGGGRFAICPTYAIDANGQEVEGPHNNPSRFRIIQVPADAPPITSDDLSEDGARALVESALGEYAAAYNFHPPMCRLTKLTTGGPAVWMVTWYDTDYTPPWDQAPLAISAQIASIMNTPALGDHYQQAFIVGEISDAQWDENIPAPGGWPTVGDYANSLPTLRDWVSRWISVDKAPSTMPAAMLRYTQHATLGGIDVTCQPFSVGAGLSADGFFTVPVANIATTLDGVPQFVAVSEYCAGESSARPQFRNRLIAAFNLVWASRPVPSRVGLIHPESVASQWVIRALFEYAFMKLRFDRPHFCGAKALPCAWDDGERNPWIMQDRLGGQRRPAGRCPGRVWLVTIDLQGTPIEDVRAKASKIASYVGADWMRIDVDERSQCVFACGITPSQAHIVGERALELVTRLDWEGAWADVKVMGVGGALPRLESVAPLEKNPKVLSIEFDIPPGVSFDKVKGAVEKLKVSTGNAFITASRTGRADRIHMMVAETDPIPFPAGYDVDTIRALAREGKGGIAFATGVEGTPVVWYPKSSPHILVAGTTGGGKSVAMQPMIVGALADGYEVAVVDPSKGCADFAFAEPYCVAQAKTLGEALAVVERAYQMVVERKSANSAAGVGSYRDLPADQRPAPFLLVIDEFTSLMTPEPVGKPSEDMEVEAKRQQVVAENTIRAKIGTFVGRIAREARSAGVILVLGTQKLSSQMLSTIPGAGDLKSMLARILLGKATYGDRMSALRDANTAPDVGDIVPPGRGVFEPSDSAGQIIQAWFDPGEQDFLAGVLTDLGTPTAQAWDVSGRDVEADASMVSVVDETEVADLGVVEFSLDELGLAADQAAETGESDEWNVEVADAPSDQATSLDGWNSQASDTTLNEPTDQWDVEVVGESSDTTPDENVAQWDDQADEPTDPWNVEDVGTDDQITSLDEWNSQAAEPDDGVGELDVEVGSEPGDQTTGTTPDEGVDQWDVEGTDSTSQTTDTTPDENVTQRDEQAEYPGVTITLDDFDGDELIIQAGNTPGTTITEIVTRALARYPTAHAITIHHDHPTSRDDMDLSIRDYAMEAADGRSVRVVKTPRHVRTRSEMLADFDDA